MANSSLSNVNVTIYEPYTLTEPIRFRRYTIFHREDPQIVDLSISPYFYNLDLSTVSTNLIYGQWHWFSGDIYQLILFVFIGNYEFDIVNERYEKFVEKIDLSIGAVINGDRVFLENRPQLLNTSVYVRYISSYPKFNKLVTYNKVESYLDNNVEVKIKKGV
ncbi:staygreen family protein [Paraclostridium sordellii]|uniref:staygreen family protein n=1 Tax=Paraclostridium sordellii TaxID=1505 RepID=UPI0005E7F50F|nr:staygreen family protein [Paeniclostridium sordellii]CEO20837.1 Staygreen protein [[Clostridium] sordellii] [Paeniclostridium sordellii]